MFGLFKKKEKEVEEIFKIVSPVDGELIPLTEVPDQVFSEKMMGDGFAVVPNSDTIVAPVSGTAESVFPTGHAVGIRTKEGIECLVHIGLDTVNLKGEGFQQMIKQGDKVKVGQPMVKIDREALEQKGYDLSTMVLFPSGYEHEFNLEKKTVTAGEQLI